MVVPKRVVFKTLIFVLAALFLFCPKNGVLKKPFFGSKSQNPFQRAKPFAKGPSPTRSSSAREPPRGFDFLPATVAQPWGRRGFTHPTPAAAASAKSDPRGVNPYPVAMGFSRSAGGVDPPPRPALAHAECKLSVHATAGAVTWTTRLGFSEYLQQTWILAT